MARDYTVEEQVRLQIIIEFIRQGVDATWVANEAKLLSEFVLTGEIRDDTAED